MVVAGHIGHPLLAADAAEVAFALLAVDTLGHLAVGVGIGYAALGIMQGERAVVAIVARELFVEAEHSAEMPGILEVVCATGSEGGPSGSALVRAGQDSDVA